MSDSPGADVTIRPLATHAERSACLDLQEEVWGRGFQERLPPAMLDIAERLGGVGAGAFTAADELVGFVFGITGVEEGRPVHWSHMLAVREGHAGRGVGRRLKAYQRRRLLDLGVTRVYWTFEPLESRNAWLNLGRLGAVGASYIEDMYGDSDSPRHRAVGTDRLLALWRLDSPRVRDRLDGRRPPRMPAEASTAPRAFDVEVVDGLPRPAGEVTVPGERPFLVPIPRDLQSVVTADAGLAAGWRDATRTVLRSALDAGAEVRELVETGELTSALLVDRP